ncbi:glutaredoxin [Mesorhizobium sp. AR07]|nr:glutaredoxin [Mesorhizobium sp. AR07]
MPTKVAPWIEIFTTPTCPDCVALKRWLTVQKLPFDSRRGREQNP